MAKTRDAELFAALDERGLRPLADLWMGDCGRRKIQVIKEVRGLTHWGLKQAKDAVEGQARILAGVSQRRAAAAAALLESVGAEVEIALGGASGLAYDPEDPRRADQELERLRLVGLDGAIDRGGLGDWSPGELEGHDDPAAALAWVDEQLARWAEAGRLHVARELELVAALSEREPVLEARIREAEDDETRAREAAVFADWLQSRGDPRGQIGATALAGSLADEHAALVERHLGQLFGPARAAFEAGALPCTWTGPVLDSLRVEIEPLEPRGELDLDDVLGLPICACLRALAIAGPAEGLAGRRLDGPQLTGLRTLELDMGRAATTLLDGVTLPRLEQLSLRGAGLRGQAPQLPALRALDLRLSSPSMDGLGEDLAFVTAPLERLALRVNAHDYWDQHAGPLSRQIAKLLERPALAQLRELSVADFDEGSPPIWGQLGDLLANSPARASLERVDLRRASLHASTRANLEDRRADLPELLLP